MLKRPNNEMEAAAAAAMEGIQQDLEETRLAAARKAKALQLIMPTDAEDASITAAALDDPDNQPLTHEQLDQFKPARRGRGRPAGSGTKVAINLRLDRDLLEAFKGTGDGWQTRLNDALREWAKGHRIVAE